MYVGSSSVTLVKTSCKTLLTKMLLFVVHARMKIENNAELSESASISGIGPPPPSGKHKYPLKPPWKNFWIRARVTDHILISLWKYSIIHKNWVNYVTYRYTYFAQEKANSFNVSYPVWKIAVNLNYTPRNEVAKGKILLASSSVRFLFCFSFLFFF